MNKTILAAQITYDMGIALFLATYILYFETIGLRIDQISFVDVVFNLGILLFELPTGVIADRYGRRKAFILSCVVRGLALVGLGFGVTIYEVAFLIFLTAIGEAMVSGASVSWLISNLRKGTRIRDVYRALALIGGAAGLIFGTIGAALFTYSSSLIWFSSGAVLGVAGLVAFFAPEGPVEDPKDKPSSLRSIIQDVLTLSGRLWREVPLVQVIILQAAAGAGAGLYWQLVVIERSVSWAPSAVWIAFSLAGMAGAWAARFAPQRSEALLLLLAISQGVLLPLGWIAGAWMALAFFLLHIFLMAAVWPSLGEIMNAHIPEKIRASALSMLSLISSLAVIIGVLFAGAVGERFGSGQAISLPAALGCIGILIVALRIKNRKGNGTS